MWRTGPRYQGLGSQPSSASVQCQKCLERGHWTYQCKKDRSYRSRPSRTQQLKKPLKLYQPELPKELQDKKGLADKILKKKKKERKRRGSYSSSSESSSDSSSESDSVVAAVVAAAAEVVVEAQVLRAEVASAHRVVPVEALQETEEGEEGEEARVHILNDEEEV
ncbi:uncharacterized protein RHIMIDRAFT_288317 [Rhizopus microsporus ATCC 52813]|uniref:Zinc knuckle domain-containing protein n=1 Tax=Rhizopus microsporus ATCC 52813 TaxID=1340429 RepID=A0A2G4T9N2_RHIZD|nr:uncharacterized protein RHIMIDRAFT_288317 [Rhizopus microsporus ATCC 52813]PHZ17416.1 hypothetical protein RHIMIDRAFT_288317 [Rhizopus microsporus ATCC 52813]